MTWVRKTAEIRAKGIRQRRTTPPENEHSMPKRLRLNEMTVLVCLAWFLEI